MRSSFGQILFLQTLSRIEKSFQVKLRIIVLIKCRLSCAISLIKSAVNCIFWTVRNFLVFHDSYVYFLYFSLCQTCASYNDIFYISLRACTKIPKMNLVFCLYIFIWISNRMTQTKHYQSKKRGSKMVIIVNKCGTETMCIKNNKRISHVLLSQPH